MSFKYLDKLVNEFDITTEEARKALLRYSEDINIKLMHTVEEKIVVPESLCSAITFAKESLQSLLTDYDIIREQATDTIPFKRESTIYYLFNGEELIYIGQTDCVAGRINEHAKNKIFNRVYTEKPKNTSLVLTIESLYIVRDKPPMNIASMTNYDLFYKILSHSKYTDDSTFS